MQAVSKIVHDRVMSSSPQTTSVDTGGAISAIAQNRDGTSVVVGGRTVFKIYNVDDDCFEEKYNLRVGKHVNLNYCAADIAWNNIDEHILATGATNGAVVLWNLNKSSHNKQEHVFQEHKRTVNRVCFHEGEHKILLSASQDGQINLFDMRKKEVSMSFSSGSTSVRDVQFCPHQLNYFAFASADEGGNLMIWDMRRPDRVEKQLTAHSGPVFTINWHPEDRGLFATAGRDRMIKVWDLNKSKCLHTIYNIASLARIKWRPQRRYHIASCSLLVDNSIHVWDIRRPYVPFASFLQHKDVTTSMVFRNKDPHVMISGSKDMMLYQHVFRDSKRPAEDLVPSGLDISVQGVVGHAYSDRQGKMHSVSAQNRQSYFSKRSGEKNDQFVDVAAYMQVFVNAGQVLPVEVVDVFNVEQQLNYWVETAKRYILAGKPVEELCKHNSKVAESLSRHQVAQAWMTVLTLFNAHNVVETKVQTHHRTFSVTTVTTEKSDHHDKGKHSKEMKVETDVEEKNLDGTSGNSEEETDDREMFDTKLASIARGQVNPDWDILFGDGEQGLDDNLLINGFCNNNNNKTEWSLPPEAFSLRHEIHDRDTVLEGLPEGAGGSQRHELHETAVESDAVNSDAQPGDTARERHSNNNLLACDMTLLALPDWSFAMHIVDMMKALAAEGDVQTPVSMLIVFKNQLREYVDSDLQEDWFLSYIELLGRFKLWTIANYVMKMSGLVSVSMLNQQSTTIYLKCTQCDKPMNQAGWLCYRCKKITNYCAICHLPVKGLFLWCQGCGHGGHLQHMKDWLSRNIECPTGCGHICEYT